MFFTKHQNLSEKIVAYLAYHPHAALEEIRTVIEFGEKTGTKQWWYKHIRALLRQGVMVKYQKRYSLNAAWAGNVAHLVFFMSSNYLNGKSTHAIRLPRKNGERVKYHFPDLISMDTFWGHVMITLVSSMPGVPFYAYNPHTWFFVAHPYESQIYFESMKIYKTPNYTVVGGRTNIDLAAETLHPKGLTKYYCSPRPIPSFHDHYLTAIGDYYILVKLKSEVNKQIEALLKTIHLPISQEQTKEIERFFKQKSPCNMTIMKDAKRSSTFSKKIARHF